jgi:hypothetical protein
MNKKQPMRGVRTIKAWAWVTNDGKLMQDGVDYKIHNNSTYKGTIGDKITIIPVLITPLPPIKRLTKKK